jgi:hypothetical protein
MEIKKIAKELVKEIEYESRNTVRLFEEGYRLALMNEFKEEGLDFSDKELEDFIEELREKFLELAEKKGWKIDYCNETIIITKGGKK